MQSMTVEPHPSPFEVAWTAFRQSKEYVFWSETVFPDATEEHLKHFFFQGWRAAEYFQYKRLPTLVSLWNTETMDPAE